MTETTHNYADISKAIVDLVDTAKGNVKDLLTDLVSAIETEMAPLEDLAPEVTVKGLAELRSIVSNAKHSLATLERVDPMMMAPPMPAPMPTPPAM